MKGVPGDEEGDRQQEPGMGPLTQSAPLQPVVPPHCPATKHREPVALIIEAKLKKAEVKQL